MEFKTGQTKVRVMKKSEAGKIEEIHTGIVVQQGTHFVRVYNGDKDTGMANAELFPIASKLCWVETIGELKTPLRIVPELR